MRGELREGYIAKWKKYPTDEIKIRVARPSHLGPSEDLLKAIKNDVISWVEYEIDFRREMEKPFAQNEIAIIREMLNAGINVRLLCYEKNPPCHRFILIDIIEEGMKK